MLLLTRYIIFNDELPRGLVIGDDALVHGRMARPRVSVVGGGPNHLISPLLKFRVRDRVWLSEHEMDQDCTDNGVRLGLGAYWIEQ